MIVSDNPKARILACDFGTSGLTIGLYNPGANRMEAFGGAEYAHMKDLGGSRWLEQDPRDWIKAIPTAMLEIRKQVDLGAVEVVGIGIGGHMHALVVLDGHDQPVMQGGKLLSGGIMWNDPRGEEQAAALAAELDEPIPARMTIARTRWLAEQHPDAWQKLVHRVTVPSSYIALELTGAFGVGPGDASGMAGQLDAQGSFDRAKLERILPGLAERMPKVGKTGDVLGRLNARGADLLGLPQGIPVAYPEGDQPVGMVASGCVLAGQASVSLGNSVVFNAVGTAPILNERGVIDSFRTALGDHLLMTCVTSGCIVYDELVDLFAPLWSGTADALRDWLADEAAPVPAGALHVTALPFYLGEGVFRQPHAFASLVGMRQGSLRAGVLARASMEATCLVMRYGHDRMKLGGLKELVVSGGGSKNKLWPQILADVFGVPVRKPQDAHEAATRGAAYLALYMCQRQAGNSQPLNELLAERVQLDAPIEPQAENTAVYNEMLPAFEQTLNCTVPLYSNPWYAV